MSFAPACTAAAPCPTTTPCAEPSPCPAPPVSSSIESAPCVQTGTYAAYSHRCCRRDGNDAQEDCRPGTVAVVDPLPPANSWVEMLRQGLMRPLRCCHTCTRGKFYHDHHHVPRTSRCRKYRLLSQGFLLHRSSPLWDANAVESDLGCGNDEDCKYDCETGTCWLCWTDLNAKTAATE